MLGISIPSNEGKRTTSRLDEVRGVDLRFDIVSVSRTGAFAPNSYT